MDIIAHGTMITTGIVRITGMASTGVGTAHTGIIRGIIIITTIITITTTSVMTVMVQDMAWDTVPMAAATISATMWLAYAAATAPRDR